jgi:hypothetical protein
MPYVVVDNFSGGLDSRRHVLNSKTGTLSVLKNAHVTRGGEIEKRKAFNIIGDASGDTPANIDVPTFGLEATSDGIYVFGDQVANPVSEYDINNGLNGNDVNGFPYIKYQRLAYPLFPDSMGNDLGLPSFDLTKIVYSTVYGGRPFVVAGFGNDDGNPTHTIPYYDGAAIKDWYQGYWFNGDQLASGDFITSFLSYFPVSGYTASRGVINYDFYIDITGPAGKPFTVTESSDLVGDPVVTLLQAHKEEVPETLSSGSFKISEGSEGIARFDRVLKDCYPSPNITAVRFGASSATATDGVDITMMGSGSYINYNSIAGTSDAYDTGQRLAYAISYFINLNSATTKNTAIYVNAGSRTGNDRGQVQILADATLGADGNGKLIQIEFLGNPTSYANISELIDTATIAVSPYNPTQYIATFGTTAGGVNNGITSIKVDGVEVLGSPVAWVNSNSATSAAVVAKINSYTSSPEYIASVSDSKIVIKSLAGTGKSNNGKAISVTTSGSVLVTGVTPFDGGTDLVAAVSQVTRVDYIGLYLYQQLAGKKISLTIVDPDNPSVPIIVGASRVAGKFANFSTTYKSKEYAGSGSTLYFSAVNDATKWDIYDTGSGFIDMSNNFGGREDLTGVGVYQNYLAVFSRRSVQLWSMDADPTNNAQVQVIANTGALSPDSIVSVGSIDLLYLADNGIRSLRARENTDTAFSSDIGSAIDSIIIQHMADTGDAKYSAKAIIEPVDGRYWIAIYDKIYVLSYFPGSNISAWSVYEPGFVVEEMVTREDRVFLRGGDGKIYVYGDAGASGGEYDDCEVVVELPYLDGNKPATYKEAKGIDMTCAGEWKVYLGFDHTNPTARDLVATVTQPTFALGKVTATGAGTHFGPRFVHESNGPALLANFIVHFDEMHSKHDAG